MSWAIELVAVVSSAAAARGRAAPAATASASGSRRGMGACYQRASPRGGSRRPGEVDHRRSWRGSENLGRDPHAAGGEARGDADAGLHGARGKSAAGERAGDAVDGGIG